MNHKSKNTVKLGGLVTLAGAALVYLGADGAQQAAQAVPGFGPAQPAMLYVVQDESSLEHQIGDYLRSKGLKVLYRSASPNGNGNGATATDDGLLLLFSLGNKMPDFSVLIDTQPSASDPKRPGVATERAVTIRLYTGTYVRPAQRNEALDLLCARHRRVWAGTYWVDTDGELVCSWVLNITSAGLPVENVVDAVVRIVSNWEDFFPTAKPIMGEYRPGRLMPAPTERSESHAA